MSEAHAEPHESNSGHEPVAGGGDDHGDDHGAEPLGPVDRQAWGAALLGIALGLVVALGFVFATGAVRS